MQTTVFDEGIHELFIMFVAILMPLGYLPWETCQVITDRDKLRGVTILSQHGDAEHILT